MRGTLRAERDRVFHLAKKIGHSISGLMITVGTLTSLTATQYLFHVFDSRFFNVEKLLTPELTLILLGILGATNLICGLVLISWR